MKVKLHQTGNVVEMHDDMAESLLKHRPRAFERVEHEKVELKEPKKKKKKKHENKD